MELGGRQRSHREMDREGFTALLKRGCERPSKTCNSGDQLGLERGRISKIGDGSRERTHRPLATAVADF